MTGKTAQSTFAVFLGLSLVLPLVNYYRVLPSSAFYSEAAAGVLFLCATAVCTLLVDKRPLLHVSVIAFVAGLFGILAYQVLAGRYVYVLSLAGWVAYLATFFIAVTIGQCAANDQSFRSLLVDRLTVALLLAALFNAFAQTTQASGLADGIRPIVMIPAASIYEKYKCSPAGNLAQLNHANLLAWLALGALLYQVAVNRARLAFGVLGVAILLCSSALTSSRMAWLMALAVAFLVVVGRQSLGWSRRNALLTAALLVAGLLAATFAKKLLLGDECTTSLDRALGPERALDYAVRLDLMRQALQVWWSQPVTGVGAGNFMATAFSLAPNLDLVRPFDYFPHNAPLEVLASFGLIGAALLVCCGVVWLMRGWKHLRVAAEHWPMAAGLAVLLIHSLLEYPLWYLFFLIPFGLMLGVVIGPSQPTDWSLRLPARWIFAAVAIVGIPAYVYAAVDHAKAERALWLSQMAREHKELSGAAVEQLSRLVGELTVFKLAAEREVLRFAEINKGNLDGLRAANSRLLNSAPDPLTIARAILLESMAGNPEGARDLFRRLMVFYPTAWEELATEMRKRVDERPEDFGGLAAIIDEEASNPPRKRF